MYIAGVILALMAHYLNREPHNQRNRVTSPQGSGELVQLFEGAWHQAPINEELIDGTKLTVTDFHQVAVEALGKRAAQGTQAFGIMFNVLWGRAPTQWEPPDWWEWQVRHKREIILATQAVADVVQEHLAEPKKALLTPVAAEIAHFVVYDFPLGHEIPLRQSDVH